MTSVAVSLDGVPMPGTRTDIDSCSVIEVEWGEETVFCTGLPTGADQAVLGIVVPALLGVPPMHGLGRIPHVGHEVGEVAGDHWPVPAQWTDDGLKVLV